MKLRSNFLPRLTNREVEEYLSQNDLIFMGVGCVEMHGELPLDCETVLAEAYALRMAQKCNALVLPNLQYFFAGCTEFGRGTVQVGVRDGIDYLGAIARNLLKKGFRRQIYITSHGPSRLTVGSMVRDFFEETKVPILYIESSAVMPKRPAGEHRHERNSMFFGAYDLLGRLEDIPLTTPETDMSEPKELTVAFATPIIKMGTCGHYVAAQIDHAPTPRVDTDAERRRLAERGKVLIDEFIDSLNVPDMVERLRSLDHFTADLLEKYPWL